MKNGYVWELCQISDKDPKVLLNSQMIWLHPLIYNKPVLILF